MNVSIIIVNYKSAELTVNCITSIKNYTSEITYEVVIVDNFSEDNSESIIKKNHPPPYARPYFRHFQETQDTPG